MFTVGADPRTMFVGGELLTDKFEELDRLSQLLDEGKLTRAEYESLKKELLAGASGSGAHQTPPTRHKPPEGRRIKNSTMLVIIGAVVLGIIWIGNQASEPSIEEIFADVSAALDSGDSRGGSSTPERIELEGKGDGATRSFRLNGGSYRVATRVSGECYYSFTLSNPSTGSTVERITTMSDPESTAVMLHGIRAGSYYVEVITGPAPACPWTQVFTSS